MIHHLIRYLDYSNQDEMEVMSLTTFVWFLVDRVTGRGYQRAMATYL